MSAVLKKSNDSQTCSEKSGREPLRLKTTEEVREYLARHLTPVRLGPKGQPIYALEDLASLNVIFPEDD